MTALFFARDPGAANVLIPLFESFEGDKVFWAKDFAREVVGAHQLSYKDFNKEVADQNISLKDKNSIDNWLNEHKPDCLITGTTDLDDLSDRFIWLWAQNNNVHSIAVLDSWLRLKDRFFVDNNSYFPHHVLSLSEDLTEELKQHIPRSTQAHTLGHPHLSEFFKNRQQLLKQRESGREIVKKLFAIEFEKLFVFASEPRKEFKVLITCYGKAAQSEVDCYRNIQEGLQSTPWSQNPLIVKLHPREAPSNYGLLSSTIVQSEISAHQLMAAADVIFGMSSMFLIESVILEKTVLSFETVEEEYGGLITNKLGLSYPIPDEDTFLSIMNDLEKYGPKPLEEIKSKLGLNTNWKTIFLDLIKSL